MPLVALSDSHLFLPSISHLISSHLTSSYTAASTGTTTADRTAASTGTADRAADRDRVDSFRVTSSHLNPIQLDFTEIHNLSTPFPFIVRLGFVFEWPRVSV